MYPVQLQPPVTQVQVIDGLQNHTEHKWIHRTCTFCVSGEVYLFFYVGYINFHVAHISHRLNKNRKSDRQAVADPVSGFEPLNAGDAL